MAKVQKTYTKEFKEEAVRRAQSSGKPITQVGRSLGISDTSLHQWRKELSEHGKEAFPESRAPDGAGRRESSSQTRTRESPTGARDTKKSSEHL